MCDESRVKFVQSADLFSNEAIASLVVVGYSLNRTVGDRLLT